MAEDATESQNIPAVIETAIIKVNPSRDETVIALLTEVQGLFQWAEVRTIAADVDVKSATEDLSLIAKVKKAIEDKRKEYTNPINEHLKAVNESFKTLTGPLEQADKITRGKILAYRQEQARRAKEAEEINRQKEELARREAAFNGTGEVIDTTPVVVPPMPPAHVRTEVGTLGTMKVRKWEVEDLSKVPLDYLMIDAAKVGKVVRAGIPSIPGIRIWEEDTLRVSTK